MLSSFSARSRAIEPFHVMALLARAHELQAEGHDVIHLEIGEPDFTTAEPIIAAGQAALAAGHTRYTSARGLPQLREALAGFYAQRYGVSLDPERILITPGGSGACCWRAACWWIRAGTGCWPIPAIPATATSSAWWRALPNWCRSARRHVIN